MLPPVRAALSSTADYQSQAQAATSRARVDVASSAQSQSGNDATLSGARLDAASLSGQLKLAQGSSILAETIGKLLKTPRRENEALLDYTTRLFEAVQALKPQEVANVERLLNQIVKGISLRLMAEILREPSGPTAARLAAHIEAANIAQRDLAANTVVSFYRQNASADPPLNANNPRMPQSGNPATTPTNQTTQAPAVTADDPVAARNQPAGNNVLPKTAEGQNQRLANGSSPSATPAPQVLKSEQTEQTSRPTTGVNGQSSTTASQDMSGRPTVTSNEAAGPTRAATPQASAQTDPKPSAEQPQSHGSSSGTLGNPGNLAKAEAAKAVTGNQAPVVTNEAVKQAGAEKPNEMQALARTAMELFKLDTPVPARLWSALSDQTLLKLANWLATALSELDLPETASMPAPSSADPTAADDKALEQRASSGPNMPTPGQTNPASAPSQTTGSDRPHAAALAAAVTGADTTEQQLAAMAVSTLPAAREALPWPYVAAYPPGEEEPRREQRKTPPIEAIEDEEQDGSSQQHASDDDQQESEEPQDDVQDEEETVRDTMTAAEKAAGYRANEASVEAEAPEASPSDLYWRMAGWTDDRAEDVAKSKRLADMKKAAEPLGPATFVNSGNDDYSLLPRFFRAAPRMSPSEAPESDEPN